MQKKGTSAIFLVYFHFSILVYTLSLLKGFICIGNKAKSTKSHSSNVDEAGKQLCFMEHHIIAFFTRDINEFQQF